MRKNFQLLSLGIDVIQHEIIKSASNRFFFVANNIVLLSLVDRMYELCEREEGKNQFTSEKGEMKLNGREKGWNMLKHFYLLI